MDLFLMIDPKDFQKGTGRLTFVQNDGFPGAQRANDFSGKGWLVVAPWKFVNLKTRYPISKASNTIQIFRGHASGEESMLATARRSSSSCTGAFTAEMALATLERTVNESRALSRPVSIKPISCHEPLQVASLLVMSFLFGERNLFFWLRVNHSLS